MVRCRSLAEPFQVEFSNGALTGVCDATEDKGGQGNGFRPHELLEAALGTCTSMIIGMYAKNHGIALENVAVTVSLDRDTPGTTAFVCEITLEGDLTDAQRERLLRAAKACPVRKTLSSAIVFREKR